MRNLHVTVVNQSGIETAEPRHHPTTSTDARRLENWWKKRDDNNNDNNNEWILIAMNAQFENASGVNAKASKD